MYRKGIGVDNSSQKSVECTIDSIRCDISDDSSCDEGSIEISSLNYSKDKYGLTKEDYRNFKISKDTDAVRSESIHNLKNSQEKNKFLLRLTLDMFALRHWKHWYTSNLKSTLFKNSKYYEWAVLRQTSKSSYKCNCSVDICQHILLIKTLGENDLKFAKQAPTNGTLFEIKGSFHFRLYIDTTKFLLPNIQLTLAMKRADSQTIPVRCPTCVPSLTIVSERSKFKSKKKKHLHYSESEQVNNRCCHRCALEEWKPELCVVDKLKLVEETSDLNRGLEVSVKHKLVDFPHVENDEVCVTHERIKFPPSFEEQQRHLTT